MACKLVGVTSPSSSLVPWLSRAIGQREARSGPRRRASVGEERSGERRSRLHGEPGERVRSVQCTVEGAGSTATRGSTVESVAGELASSARARRRLPSPPPLAFAAHLTQREADRTRQHSRPPAHARAATAASSSPVAPSPPPSPRGRPYFGRPVRPPAAAWSSPTRTSTTCDLVPPRTALQPHSHRPCRPPAPTRPRRPPSGPVRRAQSRSPPLGTGVQPEQALVSDLSCASHVVSSSRGLR